MRCLAGSLLRLDGALNNWIYNHRVTKPITASSMVDASSRNDPKPAFTESLCSYVHTTSQNAIIILLLKQAYFGVYLPSYRTVFCGGHEMPTVPVTVRGGGIYHHSASPSSQASVRLTNLPSYRILWRDQNHQCKMSTWGAERTVCLRIWKTYLFSKRSHLVLEIYCKQFYLLLKFYRFSSASYTVILKNSPSY